MGRVVEVLADMPFDVYLEEQIFRPLGMNDTAFSVPAEKIGRLAVEYDVTGGSLKVRDTPQTSSYRSPVKLFSGEGGLVSTAPDYLRFAQMLLNEGEFEGTRFLTSDTVERMTTNQLFGDLYPIQILGNH